MANKPTLLIGIGSSGLYTLEQVQNFYYENTGMNKPAWVEYVYIETNKDNRPNITVLKNNIKRVYISLAEMEKMVKELKEESEKTHVSTDWLPPEDEIIDAGKGAGGIPACGRLALWGWNNEGKNFKKVIDTITLAFDKIKSFTVEGSDDSSPAVFVTGSLTGGTGTGIFIDIAYLVRHLIDDIKDLYGLLLVPPKPKYIKESEIIYINTYSALKALEHYSKANISYDYNWPNGFKVSFKEPPFELVQIISQSYNANYTSLSTVQGLYKMAGLYLFLNIFGLRAKRFERLVDAKGNAQIGKFGTFGLSAIQYPKAQIQEYLSLNLSIDLLKRWIDQENYFKQGYGLPIDKAKINNDAVKYFERVLEESFNVLNVVGGRDVNQEINLEAHKINKGDLQGRPFDYIRKMFSSSVIGNIYDSVRNNLRIAQDTIIEGISSFVINDINQHENLHYARIQLNAIANAITKCLNYWQSIGVSSVPNNWESLLSQQTKWMLRGRYKILFEQDNVLADRMTSLLQMMKMHLMVKMMVDIRKNIQAGKVPLVTSNVGSRIELPTVEKIKLLITEIKKTLGTEQDIQKEKKFKSLRRRKSEITGDIQDNTIPILRIYPSNSFEQEITQAEARYRNITRKTYPTKETIIGNRDLWDYLTQTKLNLHRILYRDCLLMFREELNNSNCIPDYEVSEYVERAPEEAARIAKRSTSYLLPVDKTLEQYKNIPKVVIGSNQLIIKKVVSHLQEEGVMDFTQEGDNIKEIEELKNIMIFYVEQGNFMPVQDISYMNEIEEIYNNYPKQKNISDAKWHKLRNPYIKLNQQEEESELMEEEEKTAKKEKLKKKGKATKKEKLKKKEKAAKKEKLKKKEKVAEEGSPIEDEKLTNKEELKEEEKSAEDLWEDL